MKRLGVLLATAGGAGYSPFAPGTAGSLVGILIFLLTEGWSDGAQIALVVAISLVGIWASSVGADHFQKKDPGQVVIDEVAGQLLTLCLVRPSGLGIAAGFLLFRALDIVKPWPARQFERFPGGIGIMADDLMVAVYGNLLMRAALHVLPMLAA